MLQLLQFEVGVHRDDPSSRVWLQRAAETEGITAKHVDWMGVICLEQRTRGLHRRPGHLCDTASHMLCPGASYRCQRVACGLHQCKRAAASRALTL